MAAPSNQYRPVVDDPEAPPNMVQRWQAGTLLLFDVDDAPMLEKRDMVMNICMVQVALSFVLLTNWRRSPVLLILHPFFIAAGVLGWYGAKHCKSVYVAAHFMGSAGLALVFLFFILAETFLKHTQGQQTATADLYFIILNVGIFPCLFAIVDEVSVNIILMMVGLLVCQQAVAVSDTRHMPALFIGIMCLICDWATLNANATNIGIHNIAAGGGIMASLIIPAIICDLIDNRFGRAGGYAVLACVFSEFGVMHGMNPVNIDDLVPSSFPFFGTGDMVVKGQLTASFQDTHPGWTAAGHGSALCSQPPEFRVDQAKPDGTPAVGMNEGWRFSVAYAALALFCFGHMGLQKMGFINPAIMDNGVNPHYVKGQIAGGEGGTEMTTSKTETKFADMSKEMAASNA